MSHDQVHQYQLPAGVPQLGLSEEEGEADGDHRLGPHPLILLSPGHHIQVSLQTQLRNMIKVNFNTLMRHLSSNVIFKTITGESKSQ